MDEVYIYSFDVDLFLSISEINRFNIMLVTLIFNSILMTFPIVNISRGIYFRVICERLINLQYVLSIVMHKLNLG